LRKISRLSLVAVIAAVLFGGLIYLLAWSSIFTVSSITVIGSPTPESQSAITKISEVATGEKLARVEPQAIEKRLLHLKWIESAQVSRNWLDGAVEILVTPRTPTAIFNGSTIDASGTIFTLPGFTTVDLPRVSAKTPALGLAAIKVFQGLPRAFQRSVISLTARNSSNFALFVDVDGRNVQILWGANEETALKIEVISALLALEENKKIRRIDVSAPHAPIVK
jgi:cell division septal protein FtsQ